MAVVFIYPEQRDYTREVEEYIHDYTVRTGGEVQVVDPESREGADFCRAYDVVEYPTILGLADNGSVLKEWRGRPLPLMAEVEAYA